MPQPIAICLENIRATSESERYLRCVAITGSTPGLFIKNNGEVTWLVREDVACEIWVSADERLILYRPENGGNIVVRRGGRFLDVPFEKPVVLLDQDRIEVGGRFLKLHVHGLSQVVQAPSFLPVKTETKTSRTAKMAAAVALSAVVSTTACSGSQIEVREEPPTPVEGPQDPNDQGHIEDQTGPGGQTQTVDEPPQSDSSEGSQNQNDGQVDVDETPPIDVVDNPPRIAIPEDFE